MVMMSNEQQVVPEMMPQVPASLDADFKTADGKPLCDWDNFPSQVLFNPQD